MGLGRAIGRSSLLLQWRSGFDLIIWTWSLALFHLDKTLLSKGKGEALDGRHQSCGARGPLLLGVQVLKVDRIGKGVETRPGDGVIAE